jgi:microcin C transport system substrate-binding protein
MAGEYDFHEEFNSNRWATQYDKPPVREQRIIRESLPDDLPSGVQAFFLNLRRSKFQNRNVRQSLNLAFDFEWTNSHLFFNLYRRVNSMFENSVFAAHGPPDDAELALLGPLRGQVPDEVYDRPFHAPVTDGTGSNRNNLLKAMELLRSAGWRIHDNKLIHEDGEEFTIEFLISQSSFKRIISPYIRNLRRLGIRSSIRIVDAANFQQRRQTFDFDVIMQRYSQPLTPGIEQLNHYGSEAADLPGSLNYSGIKDPAVDIILDKVVSASDRHSLITAVRALDRVLMWNYFVVPHWYKGVHNIAYWNKFGRPDREPRYGLGIIDTWWFDPEKRLN